MPKKAWNTRLRRAHRGLRTRVGVKHNLFNQLCPSCKKSFINHRATLGFSAHKKKKGIVKQINEDLIKTLEQCKKKH